jgi:hypothetical protein
MRKRTKIISFIVLGLFLLIIIDRFYFMPSRLNDIWQWDSGCLMGDPISYKQDFELHGFEIVFNGQKKVSHRNKKFLLIGCYFGEMLLYDPADGRIAHYNKW